MFWFIAFFVGLYVFATFGCTFDEKDEWDA